MNGRDVSTWYIDNEIRDKRKIQKARFIEDYSEHK